jgi:hypothetical protein
MYVSPLVFGWLCLLGGVGLTFFYPLGQRRGNHLLSSALLLALFVIAAYILIPVAWIPVGERWQALAIGVGVGLLAVLYRDVRRFIRYFQGKVYRMSQPYYWYGRAFRGRRRRRR